MDEIFQSISNKINLSDFKRNLDTKKVKTGKYFWHFSFIYICSDQKFEPYILTNSYSDIFYKQGEIQLDILKKLIGMPILEIQEWNLQKQLEQYRLNIFAGLDQLITQMKDFISTHPQDFKHIDPTTADFIELDFIDNKQPYLPTPSDAFKLILDNSHYPYHENLVFTDIKYLKPNLVHKLNSVMDGIIEAEAFFHSVTYLQNYTKTYRSEFNPQISVKGPTEALNKAISLEPSLIHYSVPKLSYMLWLKYIDREGKQLNLDALKKAITRLQSNNVN